MCQMFQNIQRIALTVLNETSRESGQFKHPRLDESLLYSQEFSSSRPQERKVVRVAAFCHDPCTSRDFFVDRLLKDIDY